MILNGSILCPHRESDLDLRFRKPPFYPLNYGDSSCYLDDLHHDDHLLLILPSIILDSQGFSLGASILV